MPLGTCTFHVKPDLVMTPESFRQSLSLNITSYPVTNKILDLVNTFELSCCLFFTCPWVALDFMAETLVDRQVFNGV